jgi:hypothetical protein
MCERERATSTFTNTLTICGEIELFLCVTEDFRISGWKKLPTVK